MAQHLVMVAAFLEADDLDVGAGPRRDRGAPGRPGARGARGARHGGLPSGRLRPGPHRVPHRAPAQRLVAPAARSWSTASAAWAGTAGPSTWPPPRRRPGSTESERIELAIVVSGVRRDLGPGRRRAARAPDPGPASAPRRPACSACTTPTPTCCSAWARGRGARVVRQGDGGRHRAARRTRSSGSRSSTASSSTSVRTTSEDGTDAGRRPVARSRQEPHGDGATPSGDGVPRLLSRATPPWSATSTAWSTAARRRCPHAVEAFGRPRRPRALRDEQRLPPPRRRRDAPARARAALHARRRGHQLAGRRLAARRPARPVGSPVLAVGGPGVARALEEAGLAPVLPRRAAACPPVAAVLQGYGPAGDRDRPRGGRLRRPGRRHVGRDEHRRAPCRPTGAWRRATGRWSARCERASAARPTSSPASRRRRCTCCAPTGSALTRRRVLAVGDRLDTDIEGAVAAGMDSLLVLTGVDDLRGLPRGRPAARRPTWVAPDLRALLEDPTESGAPWVALSRRRARGARRPGCRRAAHRGRRAGHARPRPLLGDARHR